MVNIGQIGVGYWGKNILRSMNDLQDASVVSICDSDLSQLEKILSDKKYNDIKKSFHFKDVIRDSSVDAVVVATPTKTHYAIAKIALSAGKHVFLEKPLTYKPKESMELIDLAEKNNKQLMTGHIFLYNNAIKYLKENIGSFGDIRYMTAQRNGLGPIRNDCNAMWDLVPHDISVFNYLTNSRPTHVYASGKTYIQTDKGLEDAVTVSLDYPENVMGNINASWIDPVKTRKMTLVGSEKMGVFDDMSSDKITIYDKGVDYQPKSGDYGAFQMSFRDGDIIKPNIKHNEPLKDECQVFLDSINSGKKPLSDGKNGLDIVCVLDAANKSLKEGRRVEINYSKR